MEEPAKYVLRHPIVGRRGPGNYAWHDFVFDTVRVLRRDVGTPDPGGQFRVRVYNAETSVVTFSLEGEPEFIPGEEYVLCLSELDGFAFLADPPHWRVEGGTHGAFLLRNGSATRKMIEEKLFMAVPALLTALSAVHAGGAETMTARRYRKNTVAKGIRTEPGPITLRSEGTPQLLWFRLGKSPISEMRG